MDFEITAKFLKEMGFQKSNDSSRLPDRVPCQYYSLRIHDSTWLAYDLQDGFVELRRKRENKPKREPWITIILPKPYRTKKALKELLRVITQNQGKGKRV